MYCDNCGKEIPKHAAFCSSCGSKVSNGGTAAVAKPKSHKFSIFPIIFATVAFVIIILLLVYVKFRENNAAGADLSESVAPSASASVIPSPEIQGLWITKDDILAAINRRLGAGDYPTVNVEDKKDISVDGHTELACEYYALGSGFSFFFIRDTATGELLQFVYYVDRSKLAPDAYELLGYLDGYLPHFFEPDTSVKLSNELGLSQYQGDADFNTSASRKDRDYYYVKDVDVSCLYVVTSGIEFIPIDQYLPPETPTASVPPAAPAPSEAPAATPSQNTQASAPKPTYENVTFTGGVYADVDFTTGKFSNPITECYPDETAWVGGRLSGTNDEPDAVFIWSFPDGTRLINDNKYFGDQFCADAWTLENRGFGTVTVTIKLKETGQVLGTYTFIIKQPLNIPAATPTPAPTPAYAGYLIIMHGGIYTPSAADAVTEFHTTDTITVTGKISGITKIENLLFTITYPNGQTRSFKYEETKNEEWSSADFAADSGGYGAGTITVKLASTGAILATYSFTII